MENPRGVAQDEALQMSCSLSFPPVRIRMSAEPALLSAPWSWSTNSPVESMPARVAPVRRARPRAKALHRAPCRAPIEAPRAPIGTDPGTTQETF